MRKGEVGDHKTHFTDAKVNEMFEAWIKDNTKGTDLKFDYGEKAVD